jgi:hypothetical protein
MRWTTPADLRSQVHRLWDRGVLLAALSGQKTGFPRRLTLKGPDSRDLSDRFPEVRAWIAQLSSAQKHYRIEWRNVRHRVLGTNEIPAAIWIDTLDDALGLIGKRRAAEQFTALVSLTRECHPELVPWLAKRPLRALELADNWPHLLDIVAWLLRHPRPGIYLRQIDLPGVHSKFIERHRVVLGELFDLALPPDKIDTEFTGVDGFCGRYGFRDKPSRVRFRILDSGLALIPADSARDITLTTAAFSELNMPVTNVFVTENEINFLAFPHLRGAIVIFGAGYGFENLAGAPWLRERDIGYWGDIDTHGFAILNQFRGFFPQATSFLMDRRTLLAHRSLWGVEAQPETGTLNRLDPEESALYDELRQHRWGDRIRLEQERIGFNFLLEALHRL